MATHLWRPSKMSHSEKNVAKHWVKHTFATTAKTRDVRKGESLRGMVSHGRPDNCKVLRSDSAKIKAKLQFGFQFCLRSRLLWHAGGRQRLSFGVAHCAELRSFRRGWIALRWQKYHIQQQVRRTERWNLALYLCKERGREYTYISVPPAIAATAAAKGRSWHCCTM